MKSPKDYTLRSVTDFVYDHDNNHKELQRLCIRLADEMEMRGHDWKGGAAIAVCGAATVGVICGLMFGKVMFT